MKILVKICSALILVVIVLTLIRFEAVEAELEFIDNKQNHVRADVSAVPHGSGLIVNVRIVYDSKYNCHMPEKCTVLEHSIEQDINVQTSLRVIEFSRKGNCLDGMRSACVRINDNNGVNYDRIFIGNILAPKSVDEIDIFFPSFDECDCSRSNDSINPAKIKLKKIKRPLYKFIGDMVLSV